MVVSAAGLQLVAVRDEGVGESSSVRNDLLGICLPFGSGDLMKSSGNSSDSLSDAKSA